MVSFLVVQSYHRWYFILMCVAALRIAAVHIVLLIILMSVQGKCIPGDIRAGRRPCWVMKFSGGYPVMVVVFAVAKNAKKTAGTVQNW